MGASFSQTLLLGICAPSAEHRINKLEILGLQIKINNYCSALPPASFPSHHLPSCLPSVRASLGNSSVPDEDRDSSVPVQSSDSTSPAEAQGQHSLCLSLCVHSSRNQPQIRKNAGLWLPGALQPISNQCHGLRWAAAWVTSGCHWGIMDDELL